MTYDEARAYLTEPQLREDGAFSDNSSNLNDERWMRFGKPLFEAIDTVIIEADLLRSQK